MPNEIIDVWKVVARIGDRLASATVHPRLDLCVTYEIGKRVSSPAGPLAAFMGFDAAFQGLFRA